MITIILAGGLHLGALLCLLQSALPFRFQVGLWIAVVYHFGILVQRYGPCGSRNTPISLSVSEKDRLCVQTLNGFECQGLLAPQTYVSRYCLVLRLQTKLGRTWTWFIPRDALRSDFAYRRLRARLACVRKRARSKLPKKDGQAAQDDQTHQSQGTQASCPQSPETKC